MKRIDELTAQLQAFQPSTTKESRDLDAMRKLVTTSGDPCSRSHFEPGHFTASAFVLSPDSESLLLIFHSKFHRWLQPGGHIDPDDASVLESAKREVLEETGIAQLDVLGGILDLDVHDIPPLRTEPAHKHFDVRFLFRAHSQECLAGSDAEKAQWFPVSDISNIESDRSVMRAVEKIELFLKKEQLHVRS